jgi:hypothetical protein
MKLVNGIWSIRSYAIEYKVVGDWQMFNRRYLEVGSQVVPAAMTNATAKGTWRTRSQVGKAYSCVAPPTMFV